MSLSTTEIGVIFLSLKVGFFATIITSLLGLTVAFYLERSKSWIAFVLDVIVSLPLVLPPIIVGYALLWLFSPVSPIGEVIEKVFGASLAFSWIAATLAAAIVSLPLVVSMFRISIHGVNNELIMLGKSLGLSRIQTFLFIMLPLAKKGFLAGILLGFIRSLAEFGATIIVAGNIPGISQTLPLAIFTRISSGDDSGAVKLILISITLGVISITINKVILLKKM